MAFQVNDRVRLRTSIYEPADEHSPGGYCGHTGDIVVIRRVSGSDDAKWPYSVSHEDRADGNTFAVGAGEIEAAPSAAAVQLDAKD